MILGAPRPPSSSARQKLFIKGVRLVREATAHSPVHRHLREGAGVFARVQAAGLPRASSSRWKRLRDADWPRDSRGRVLLPARRCTSSTTWSSGVSYLARTRDFDRIVPLDDFDVETGGRPARAPAHPRHGRHDGALLPRQAGDARQGARPRHPRPRVRPRAQPRRASATSPSASPPPWVLKPRSEASAVGINKVRRRPTSSGRASRSSATAQSFHLVEQYHPRRRLPRRRASSPSASRSSRPSTSTASRRSRWRTAAASSSRAPSPRDVAGRAGAPARSTTSLHRRSASSAASRTPSSSGARDGRSTSSRRRRASAARTSPTRSRRPPASTSGASGRRSRSPANTATTSCRPRARTTPASSSRSRARSRPTPRAYDDPEIVFRLCKRHHVGLVVASPDPGRVEYLLDTYVRRLLHDFSATLPSAERATS